MNLISASILVLLYALPSTSLVSAQISTSNSYSLPNDITTYLPACAQPCLQSFVETNYPASLCSTSPTLNCLCSHNSTSGYTLGEGALQCILGEQSINACQGVNSSASAVLEALNMCFGRPSALPNTHSIITATLVVPSSAPTIVLDVATGHDESVPTTTTTTTSASTPSAMASAMRTISPSIGSTTTGNAGHPNATVLAAPQTAQSSAVPAGLTAAQISGIAVGGASVAILTISGLVIFMCARRRGKLRHDNESDFGTFHEEHGNSMEQMFRTQAEKKFLPVGPGGTANGVAAKTRPTIPPRVVTDPNMFSRRSIPVEQIGIALSPDLGLTPDSNPTPDREFEPKHSSKLLPEKPSFPKPFPKASPLPRLPPQSTLYPHWRPQFVQSPNLDPAVETRSEQRPESQVTTFEEDLPASASSPLGVFSYPIYELEDYTEEHNWRNRPLDDWQEDLVPRASTAPIEAPIRHLEVRKAKSDQSFSQPFRPLTTASSIYSAGGSFAPVPEIPHSNSQRLRHTQVAENYQPYGSNPYIPDSASVTSIESGAGEYEPRTIIIPPPELSPVAESPVGRSPVAYPKIPGRLSDGERRWEPPEEPDVEPWRQQEISDGNSRKREPNGLSISMNGAASPRKNARPTRPARPPQSASPHPSIEDDKVRLATRRGNKLAPALDLTSNKSPRRPRRVVSRDHGTDSQKMTPTKIGNDLYLNVQNI